ncbi:glycosyltransferase [Marinicella sp. S1101]|uniref:glycosyltransferase n=1 Tax=Marinicella marina TaxID=2996016 RepID=UPI002260CE88|nr:glycosyltransferase [Marinicella marina]MCX7553951.1 glycosyltransferase [Marinicella marina]
MKILHIGKFYPPYHGGMENYLCDLAEAQVSQGNEVIVWVHNHDWSWFKSKTQSTDVNGVRVIRQSALKPFLFTPIMLSFRRQLKHLMVEEKPDVIHLHWPNPSLFFLLNFKLAKTVPWLMSWHSDMVTENSRWLMRFIYRCIKPLENRLLNKTERILVSTQAYADHSPQLGVNKYKTEVLPLGIDANKIAALHARPAAEQWPENKFRLFHLGRLTFYKNQAMLVDAMSLLNDAHLLIAGSGLLANQLADQIKASAADNVELLGTQSWHQVHELYAGCDVFCMASNDRAESFGVVLLEAMLHEKIILVPDTQGSGMQYLAEKYPKGFVYQANNPADFVEKIKHIQAHLTEINQKSYDFDYSIDQVAKQIQIQYQKLISGE